MTFDPLFHSGLLPAEQRKLSSGQLQMQGKIREPQSGSQRGLGQHKIGE